MVRIPTFSRSEKRLIGIDQPIHAIVFLSFATGVTLISVWRSYPSFFGLGWDSHQEEYPNLPLEELAALSSVKHISTDRRCFNNSPSAQWKTPRALLAGAVLSLVVRIELFRRILKATECTVSSFEV